MRAGVAVAREEILQRFGVREVQATASGEEEFARRVRHAVMDGHGDARFREHFSSGEAGRSGADNDYALVRQSSHERSLWLNVARNTTSLGIVASVSSPRGCERLQPTVSRLR